MRFSNVTSMLAYAKQRPYMKEPRGRILKEEEIEFRKAYVELCAREAIHVSEHAEAIGVGKTAPYEWVKLYGSADTTQPEQAPKKKLLSDSLRKKLDKQIPEVQTLEREYAAALILEAGGYTITK